jgi:hypothetical protein
VALQAEYSFDIPKQANMDGFSLLDTPKVYNMLYRLLNWLTFYKGTIASGQKKSFVFQFLPEVSLKFETVIVDIP